MRLVFMGTQAYALPALDALSLISGGQVVGVYTPPDRPRGRGQRVEASPVKAAALQKALPVFQPRSLRSAEAQRQLASLKPDLILVAGYGLILPPEALTLPPYGCLNLHPSLLPRHRGPSPVATAILEGDDFTGVTLMQLDQGVDTGPLLAQRELPLSGTETADLLTEDLFRAGAQLLLDNLADWVSGRLPAQPQDESLATLTRKLERADGWADWSLSAVELERRQRAFTPWPGLNAQWQGKSLRLLAVAALGDGEAPENGSAATPLPSAEPGRIVALPLPDTPLGVGAAAGILALKTVQLEGRRALSAAEFSRGYPDFIGSRL